MNFWLPNWASWPVEGFNKLTCKLICSEVQIGFGTGFNTSCLLFVSSGNFSNQQKWCAHWLPWGAHFCESGFPTVRFLGIGNHQPSYGKGVYDFHRCQEIQCRSCLDHRVRVSQSHFSQADTTVLLETSRSQKQWKLNVCKFIGVRC